MSLATGSSGDSESSCNSNGNETSNKIKIFPTDVIFPTTLLSEESLRDFDNIKFGLAEFPACRDEAEMKRHMKEGYTFTQGGGPKLVPYRDLNSQKIENMGNRDVYLIDRTSIRPDMYVRNISSGEIGYCRVVRNKYDLLIRGPESAEGKFVLPNIDESELSPMDEAYPGKFIYSKGDIGLVAHITRRVTCEIADFKIPYIDATVHRGFFERDYKHIDHNRLDPYSIKENLQGDEILLHRALFNEINWHGGNNPSYMLQAQKMFVAPKAKVISNEITSMRINWLYKIRHFDEVEPVEELYTRQENILLDLPHEDYIWYGSIRKFEFQPFKEESSIISTESWCRHFKEKFRILSSDDCQDGYLQAVKRARYDEKKLSKKLVYSFRDLSHLFKDNFLVGKVILRYSTATVVWSQSGVSENVSVLNLLPFYPPLEKPFPLAPGTIVNRTCCEQHAQIDGILLSWNFSNDTSFVQFPNDASTFKTDAIVQCAMKTFPIGTIVYLKNTDNPLPSVVLGRSINGKPVVTFVKTIFEMNLEGITRAERIYFINNSLILEALLASCDAHHLSTSSVEIPVLPLVEMHKNVEAEMVFEQIMIQNRVPQKHGFFNSTYHMMSIRDVWDKEIENLKQFLPDGVRLKTYEDRLDLFSILIKGPTDGPWEGGLFHFDIYLPMSYPNEVPQVQYIEQSPNISQLIEPGGKVNLDLYWENGTSGLVNVINAIKEKILCKTPVFSSTWLYKINLLKSAKSEKISISEFIISNVVISLTNQCLNPSIVWKQEILNNCRSQIPPLVARLKRWISLTSEAELGQGEALPQFDLIPSNNTNELKANLSDLINAYNLAFS